MKYELLGGGHVEAASSLGLVEALRQDSQAWAPTVGIEDFMEEYAARCKMQNGSLVRIDTMEHFIDDLVAGGFLTPA
jgi:hypothetical protein